MVFVTVDLKRFKAYAEFCRIGSYSIHATEKGVEVRIMAGRFAYKQTFNTEEAEEKNAMQELITWCKLQDFMEIKQSIAPEIFHA